MKPNSILAAGILALLALPGISQVPQQLNYQGRVAVGGVNFNGTGQFKFALVDAGYNQSVQAMANATTTGGEVQAFVILNGSGYSSAPEVTITNGAGSSGSGATAVATLGLGSGTGTGPTDSVYQINFTNPGSGYTNAIITIAPPPPNIVHATYWSNDGTSVAGSAPANAVSLPVTNGLYSVALGDGALANMTAALSTNVFQNADVRLRVWFDDGTHEFQLLSPDQKLNAAPYAFIAGSVPNGSITNAQLANGAVDSTKLANGAISPLALNTGVAAPTVGQVLSFTNDGLRWVSGGGGSNFPFNDSFSSPASILGLSNDNGDGIYGQTGAITKSGVFGRNDVSLTIFGQPAGQGVYGFGSSKAIGVKGVSVSNDGVVGETVSAGKSGVFGTSGFGNGVAGFSEGAGNSGVFGFTGNAATYGGSFLNSHPNGIALKAFGKAEIDGALSVHTLTITGGADLAEPFAMSHGNVEPGSVVIIDELNPGKLRVSHNAYDKKVAGIVSGADGIRPGISMIQEDMLEAGENVALSGRVYVKANNSAGDIQPGDLLTTSAVPGEAMKASDHDRAQGAILGKAMTSLSESSGKVLVLVTLQ